MKLNGKNIVLGVTGGIAAYKTPELVRQLRACGAKVRVVMTENAKQFITALTLQTVSGYPVADNLFVSNAADAMEHIDYARWADLVLLAPASANIIARLSAGFADDIITSLCLATDAPLAIAPAMNQQMYLASATQHNLKTLALRGVMIWGPETGSQACGDTGAGRMREPEALRDNVIGHFSQRVSLQNLNIMITAGPTREPLDPVRYISNYSSGKMGFAIAAAAAARGEHVTLICGPVALPTPPGVQRIDVLSAQEMEDAVHQSVQQQHIFIGCAAVSDYRPLMIAKQKIKKQQSTFSVQLVKNPDIIASVATLQQGRPYVVGFAAETDNVEQYARQKLANKHLDMICANDVSQPNQGFNSDVNALHLFWSKGEKRLALNSKTAIAAQLLDEIINRYDEKNRR